jgi:hypothetical protein
MTIVVILEDIIGRDKSVGRLGGSPIVAAAEMPNG